MKMKTLKILGAVAITSSVLVPSVSLSAHHSFAAEFDGKNCKDFTGTLTKIDWQNPHGFFYLDIKAAAGKVDSWSFQTYALITLKRAGIERQLFVENIGKEVWVRGCVAKNGKAHYAAAGTLKFADGVLRQAGQLQD